jgi:hypothetical protein
MAARARLRGAERGLFYAPPSGLLVEHEFWCQTVDARSGSLQPDEIA